jgi:dTDP-glucose 4,6-dehydratase
MKVLITGGAGFIGSAVVRRFLRDPGYSIVNLDKLTYAANLDNLKEVLPHSCYAFEHADICDAGAVTAILREQDPDAIMHLAAESHVDRSIDGPDAFIETNIIGTYVLLQVTRRHYESLSPARRAAFRFHHMAESDYFTETSRYAPTSPYSATKASSDMLVRAWHHTFGIPVVTSNCSNNYGPYQFPEKLIPVVILAAIEGRPIPVYGSGNNVRDWLYVDDHADALMQILTKGKIGECYNVGGSNELTNVGLVRLICRILDELLPDSAYRPHEKLITLVADRPGHDRRYAIDAAKIKRDLDWHPKVAIEEGLQRTVTWYLQNRWWWQAIRERGFDAARIGLSGGNALANERG